MGSTSIELPQLPEWGQFFFGSFANDLQRVATRVGPSSLNMIKPRTDEMRFAPVGVWFLPRIRLVSSISTGAGCPCFLDFLLKWNRRW